MGMKQPVWQNVTHVFLLADLAPRFFSHPPQVELDDLEVFADPLLEQAFQTLAKISLTPTAEVRPGYRSPARRGRTVRFPSFTAIMAAVFAEQKKEQIFPGISRRKSGMDLFLAREILEITGMSIAETGTAGQGMQFEIIVQKGGFRFSPQKTGPVLCDAGREQAGIFER